MCALVKASLCYLSCMHMRGGPGKASRTVLLRSVNSRQVWSAHEAVITLSVVEVGLHDTRRYTCESLSSILAKRWVVQNHYSLQKKATTRTKTQHKQMFSLFSLSDRPKIVFLLRLGDDF